MSKIEPRINYIGHRVLVEPWQASYEAAIEAIGSAAHLYAADTLHTELLTGYEIESLPKFSGKQIFELQAGFEEARQAQAESTSVPATHILIRRHKLMLGVENNDFFDNSREAVNHILQTVASYTIPFNSHRENIVLGDMNATDPDTYRKTIDLLTQTVMPAAVDFMPIDAVVVLGVSSRRVAL